MRTAALAFVLFSLATITNAAENWHQFRGANGDGKSDARGIPVDFGEGSQHIQWKTAIHGKGWSSPVIWGNQIWMTTAPVDGSEMDAVCVDLESGKIVHDIKVFDVKDPQFCHPTNSYASCTPFLEAGRVYLSFGRYGTACLDSKTGKTLWSRRDLQCDHFRGPASSPVIHGDQLFLNFDGVDVQFVVALDKNTGDTVWKKTRSIDYGTKNGDRKKAYCTPKIIEFAGRPQLISPAAVETIAYEPLTGQEIWKVRHGGMNAAAKPLFAHGLVYISAGGGNLQFVAVRPDGSGDVTKSHVVWNSGKFIPHRSSQIIIDNLLFMTDDEGVASCRDAKSGELHWKQRLGGGQYWASPVYADGHVYCFSKEGAIRVFAAKSQFKIVAENKMDAGFNASAAFTEDAMIVRSFTHLYCIKE